MPQDDISALSAKVDFLLDEVKNLRAEMASMRSEFDQSRGALRLIKYSAAITAAAATVWAVAHGVKP